MDERLGALAMRQHGVVTRRQVRALGFDRNAIARRLRSGALVAINTHVYRARGAPETPRSLVMAAVLSGGPDALASGWTALALHGIRGCELLPVDVVTSRRPPVSALPGVRETFRLDPTHRTEIDGIPCVTVARALFDLAATVSPGRLARIVDTALAARRTTVAELMRVIDDLAEHGRAGSAAMRRVVADRLGDYAAPATELESAFLELVVTSGLTEPSRQVDLGGALSWIGRVDFVWRNARVVVETDGREFHDSVSDREADERRDRALETAGWTVLRFGWMDVTRRPTSVIRTLRAALAAAA
jgi:very-short-patch-repair endonuclease/predicted transcriptional regulator of viral defense system